MAIIKATASVAKQPICIANQLLSESKVSIWHVRCSPANVLFNGGPSGLFCFLHSPLDGSGGSHPPAATPRGISQWIISSISDFVSNRAAIVS